MIFSSTHTPSITEIKNLRTRLWARDFRPVAINKGAKFPYQKLWPALARQDPPHACRCITQRMPGTGILCDGLRPIDVDIDDPILAAAMCAYIEQTYGSAPYRYRHGSPRRLYLFRADQGEPRKRYVVNEQTKARVEVLGKGNQFYAFGIHPESGQPLRWVVSPEDIDRDDLPPLTDEQVQDISNFAADLIGATRKQHRASDEPMPVRTLTGSEWPVGDIRAALAVVPNHHADYDWWFMVTCAVYDACNGGGDGHQEWLAWSNQCGASSANECDKLWRALNSSPAYYTAGTLVAEARKHDPHWDRPSRAGFTFFNRSI